MVSMTRTTKRTPLDWPPPISLQAARDEVRDCLIAGGYEVTPWIVRKEANELHAQVAFARKIRALLARAENPFTCPAPPPPSYSTRAAVTQRAREGGTQPMTWWAAWEDQSFTRAYRQFMYSLEGT